MPILFLANRATAEPPVPAVPTTEPGTVYYWSVPTTPGIPGATPGISHIGHKVSALHHLQLECGIAVSPRASITRFRQMVGGQDDQRYRGDTRDTLPPQTQKDKL